MTASSRRISDTAVRRLSLYLRTLEQLGAEGAATVSSQDLATQAGTTAAQVRKDLSHFGSFGKRGLGYTVSPLRDRLTEILGLTRTWRVGLVGAGRIGSALFEYPNFRARGFCIVAVVDRDPGKLGRDWNGVPIEDAARMEQVFRNRKVDVAVLAVPASEAQGAADRVVAAGIQGILNFAPVQLRVPTGVVVNDVDLAVELETLSFALRGRRTAATEDLV